MKKSLKITLIIVAIILLFGITTGIIDHKRIIDNKEPIFTIKLVNGATGKITYLGMGYKVIRYCGVSINEPFKSNIGLKYGSWFMTYELPKDDGNKSYDSNDECCEGCMCGDTIELIKSTESAWTLSEIDNKGEYVYDIHSFINFNGTGEGKFAFFKNDKNANPISEVRGEFVINKKNEIILISTDNNKNKITCKIGEEKDLIAVMFCDNNFGMFTLQKQGTIELPSIIKDILSRTKTITIKGNNAKTITINEEKEINVLLSVIDNSKVWTGAITTPSPLYELELFDSNKISIAKILYNPSHYFSIKVNDKSYNLTNIDKNLLDPILKK